MKLAARRPSPRKPLRLLAGLTPREFMTRHWQRRPLLVRAALPTVVPPLSRTELFALAARDDVESRLVRNTPRKGWAVGHGPFPRASLPPLRQARWTLLVQGVDLHHEAAHGLLQAFRFVPDARLDDLMVSWASDGGGVGAHVDSYDVFLLQAQGRRRWRIARHYDATLDERAPLKVLRHFVAEQEFVLEPGDLLYLPPHWAHEGTAVGDDCMTCSIGMRAPQRGSLAAELMQRLAEVSDDPLPYRDAAPTRHGHTGRDTARARCIRRRSCPAARGATERRGSSARRGAQRTEAAGLVRETRRGGEAAAVALDRRTRMLYDPRHVFINGEAVEARGTDATVLRRLADDRALDARAVRGASRTVQALLAEWFAAGWLHPDQ